MRWIIKRGPAQSQKEPLYWVGGGHMIAWNEKRVNAAGFKTKSRAESAIKFHKLHFEGAHPVRVLSAEEGQRKYAAKVLREMADAIRVVVDRPRTPENFSEGVDMLLRGQERMLRAQADKEWPRKRSS